MSIWGSNSAAIFQKNVPMNHLFIQTAFLGDLLLSVPFLKQVRNWDPDSNLSLVCRQGFGFFMKELGLCHQVFEFDKITKSLTDQKVLKEEFDYVFCPHQSLTSHRLVQKIKSGHKLGYHKFWNASFFSQRVHRRLDWPEAVRQMQLLGPVCKSIERKLKTFSHTKESIPSWSRMDMPCLSWKDSEYCELVQRKNMDFRILEENYICMAPGSVWPTKQWPLDSFLRVANQLYKKGLAIVLIGSSGERSLGEKLKSKAPHCCSVIGDLSLMESVMVLARSRGLVCNDSGAMHMASLLSLPTLALFGPTVPELGYKPWNPKARVFETRELLCRPCGQHGSHHCPIGTHQCMTSIDPDRVVCKALNLFSQDVSGGYH